MQVFQNLSGGKRGKLTRVLTARKMEVREIAEMKALCPDLIQFAYIDLERSDIYHEKKHEKGVESPRQRGKRKEQEDLYRDFAQTAAATAPPSPERPGYVLLFEFTDKSVETAKAMSGGRAMQQRKKLPQKAKPPASNDIIRVIHKRNATFERAVAETLLACKEKVGA